MKITKSDEIEINETIMTTKSTIMGQELKTTKVTKAVNMTKTTTDILPQRLSIMDYFRSLTRFYSTF